MNRIGYTFEELNDTTMLEVIGGAVSTLTTVSSVGCLGLSALISATGMLASWTFLK